MVTGLDDVPSEVLKLLEKHEKKTLLKLQRLKIIFPTPNLVSILAWLPENCFLA